jgi:hypothetical protein
LFSFGITPQFIANPAYAYQRGVPLPPAKGKWNDDFKHVGPDGLTVWAMTKTTGKVKARPVATVAEAVTVALKTP